MLMKKWLNFIYLKNRWYYNKTKVRYEIFYNYYNFWEYMTYCIINTNQKYEAFYDFQSMIEYYETI